MKSEQIPFEKTHSTHHQQSFTKQFNCSFCEQLSLFTQNKHSVEVEVYLFQHFSMLQRGVPGPVMMIHTETKTKVNKLHTASPLTSTVIYNSENSVENRKCWIICAFLTLCSSFALLVYLSLEECDGYKCYLHESWELHWWKNMDLRKSLSRPWDWVVLLLLPYFPSHL